MTDIQDLTTETFHEAVHGATVPVVVDVWAAWCPPCTAIAPVLESIASDHRDELRVYKLDNDAHPAIGLEYGVMGLPTLLVFDEGRLVTRIVGARGRARLLEDLEPVLRSRV